jgi:hypothetical protein
VTTHYLLTPKYVIQTEMLPEQAAGGVRAFSACQWLLNWGLQTSCDARQRHETSAPANVFRDSAEASTRAARGGLG